MNFFKNIVKNVYNYFYETFYKNSRLIPAEIKTKNKRRITMRFYLNDPFYPDLIGSVVDPKPNGLMITAPNLSNIEESMTSISGLSGNVYAVMCHGINVFNKYFGLKKWALTNMMQINPSAGVQANAYYDRTFFKFFYFDKNNHTIYTALSADIVLHELGHGLLDAIRPDFFSAASMEVWAFHESFGDVNSILCSLHFEPILNKLLIDTNYDLRKSNLVSSVAEEFGKNLGMVCGLRQAFNDYKYVPPATLPARSNNQDAIVNEPHSFSKIMTGTFYEILCELFEKLGKDKNALIKARDYLEETFYKACLIAPCSSNFYQSFCEAWMLEDAKQKVSHKDILVKVFTKRDMFRINKLAKDNDDNSTKEKVHIIDNGKSKLEKYKLNISFKELFSDSVYPMGIENIGDLKVQLAVDEMHIQDNFMSWQTISTSVEEAKSAAKDLISYIFSNNIFGNDEKSVWTKSDDNLLVRTKFECDCYKNNCTIEGSPEYGKCWKPENNSGCCSYGSCAGNKKESSSTVEKNCNLRYHSKCTGISYNSVCK